jgi:hypothetical protein
MSCCLWSVPIGWRANLPHRCRDSLLLNGGSDVVGDGGRLFRRLWSHLSMVHEKRRRIEAERPE